MATRTARAEEIPVTLKWNKKVYSDSSIVIYLGETSNTFKQRVEAMTGVPVARQKLMAAAKNKGGGYWKGPLKDNVILDATIINTASATSTATSSSPLIITLIGSAETLAGPPKNQTQLFIEDFTPEQLQAAEDAQAQEAMASAEGMIPALQLPPHKRDDHKQEMYQYNRLVTGLPQRQIEQDLKYGQGGGGEEEETANDRTELQGKVAMTLGLELRRGYVNDLAVLDDGTCVSVLDDGHVQLWKHGAQQEDVIHAPGAEGGVNSVVALRRRRQRNNQNSAAAMAAFATTGRGILQFWSTDGDPVIAIPSVMPGTTPASLVAVYGGIGRNSINNNNNNNNNMESTTTNGDDDNDDDLITCLATRFQITRQFNPSQFRLPPQNDEERRRRAQAEAQERAMQEALGKAARSVQIFYSIGGQQLQYKMLDSADTSSSGLEGSAPITSLACLSISGGRGLGQMTRRLLIAGDSQGGLRVWQVHRSSNNGTDLVFHETGFYQLTPSSASASSSSSNCSIVCMEPLQDGRLAVSTDFATMINSSGGLLGATTLPTPGPARAVHILDFSSSYYSEEEPVAGSTTPQLSPPPTIQCTLSGHSSKDAVICMCQLPNGDFLTGGGKLDATLQLWSRAQLDGEDKPQEHQQQSDHTALLCTQPHKVLSDVGYVFALAVLPDTKNDSNYYAVAAGRYNTVKIII